jgi:penicillin-binding protein 2
MGIGQGYFLVTPLQLASATATLATRGRHIKPRVVRAVRGPTTGGERQPTQPEITRIEHHASYNWDNVIEAMLHVVEGPRGTARRIATNAYRIAGKTGTAQVFTVKQDQEYDESKVAEKMRDHALFIAFAPVEEPRIAVAVIVENGGHGGSVAAPIAKRVMDRYLVGSEGSVAPPSTRDDSR